MVPVAAWRPFNLVNNPRILRHSSRKDRTRLGRKYERIPSGEVKMVVFKEAGTPRKGSRRLKNGVMAVSEMQVVDKVGKWLQVRAYEQCCDERDARQGVE